MKLKNKRVLFIQWILPVWLMSVFTGQAVTLSLSTNVVVQDVKRFGINYTDNYYASPALKIRDSHNFEGSIYRQMITGILTTNGLIAYQGSTDLMTSTGWMDFYTNGATFTVVSGPDKGLTGSVTSVTNIDYDIWDNATLKTVPFFEFDRAVDLGTNATIRNMGILIEDLSRTGEGWIDDTNNSYRIVGDISLVTDNAPGVPGVSCARMDGSVDPAHFKLDTMYQSRADGNGDWNVHFWVKSEPGTPSVEVKTLSDDANFITNFTPSTSSWQKVELLIPVSVPDEVYPTKRQHMFQIEVTGGAVRIDQIEVWKDGYTNSTAFTDDFVDAMREMNVGVLRQVLMGGNTVSNWILRAADRQAGTFRANATLGPRGYRNDPSAGFHEVMELCEELNADPWLCLPGTLHESEVVFLMDYLAGPTNTTGGKMRADLGHLQPWAETFDNINLEFGNEAWNTVISYMFAGFNGADYWHDLIAVGKGSSSYTNNIKFHAGGQNFSTSKTESIMGSATNADHHALATYMIHAAKTNENWVFTNEDYESQFKWFMAYPMNRIYDTGMPEQLAALAAVAPNAEFSQYEFNYHTTDVDLNDPNATNIMADVNVFLPSICHGLSTANSMLAELKACNMRVQCLFTATGADNADDGAKLWGTMYSFKDGQEAYKPAFHAQAMANKVLQGDLVEATFATNPQFSAYGVFDGSKYPNTAEARDFDTLYSYAFRDGSTNGLILFNYDLTTVRPVVLDLPEYVKNNTASQWTLSAPSYTDNNQPETAPEQIVPVSTNIAFMGGTEISLAPFSMTVLQWESEGVLPEIIVSTNSVVVPEGWSTDLTIKLSAQPLNTLTVTVENVSGDADITPVSGSYIFTTSSWGIPQTLTLQAAEDDGDYTNSTAIIRCSGPEMLPVDIEAIEQENDTDMVYLLPFTETFDPGPDNMADVLGDLDGQNGWGVDGSGAATVQSNEVFAGTQAAALSGTTALHSFSNGSDTVNITLQAKPVAGPPQLGLESSGWSAIFYINSNLHVVAYSNQTPVEIASPAASNGWNQLDVACDYSAQTWALELNGTTLFTNLPFYSSRPNFSRIAVRDVVNTTTSYVDSISISSGANNPDSDEDGLPDAWELIYWEDLSTDPTDMAANGLNTVLEAYIGGIDPTDANAFFQITGLIIDSSVVVQWNTVSGRVYSVYWTSNLLSGFGAPLETDLPWTQTSYTDGVYGAEAQGFYQIKVNNQ